MLEKWVVQTIYHCTPLGINSQKQKNIKWVKAIGLALQDNLN